jgi:hypothetical protein
MERAIAIAADAAVATGCGDTGSGSGSGAATPDPGAGSAADEALLAADEAPLAADEPPTGAAYMNAAYLVLREKGLVAIEHGKLRTLVEDEYVGGRAMARKGGGLWFYVGGPRARWCLAREAGGAPSVGAVPGRPRVRTARRLP